MAGNPVSATAASALMMAFSKNVVPFSSGSSKSPSCLRATKRTSGSTRERIASISVSLWALPVATTMVRAGSSSSMSMLSSAMGPPVGLWMVGAGRGSQSRNPVTWFCRSQSFLMAA